MKGADFPALGLRTNPTPVLTRGRLGFLLAAYLGLALWLPAQVLYWDTNAKTAGAGATPTGTWTTSNSQKNWNSSSAGTASTVAWTSGQDAVFSAGTDATGGFTVTVSGTQNVSSITVEEGSPTFSGGTVNFSDATPDISIASGSTLNFGTTALTSSTGDLNLSGGGTLNLSASFNLGGTVTMGGGTLRLTDSNLSIGTLNITANSVIDFAGTASTLTLSNLVLGSGVTLTILNWSYAVDYFYSAAWTGATYDTMGSAPMNQITFNGSTASRTGWDSYDNQIRPDVPEPSAYGMLLAATAVLMLGWHRWRSV